MKPRAIITVDGTPVAGAFYERLISITVTDKAGRQADRVEMEFNDGPPSFMKMPRKGAVISVQMGYEETGIRSLGTFIADNVSGTCLPYKMRVTGRSADFRAGTLKERKERHFDKKSVGDIVKQIAGENKLIPAVSGAVASHVYKWLGQQDESDKHFLKRLAERHNALFDVKNGRLVFAEQGAGLSVSGLGLSSVIIQKRQIIPGTFSYDLPDRGKYKSVLAYHQDTDKAERVEVEVSADADGDSVYRIPDPFASLEEADKAASAKAKELQRGDMSARCTVEGNVSIRAGAPVSFAGIHPGLPSTALILDEVKQSLSKSTGLRTSLNAIAQK